MATITISLPIDRLERLKALAERLQLAPEELIRVSIDELLTRPEEDVRKALDYVVEKNSALYKRLA
jgi:predicted transcriptional regulator